MLSDAFDPYRQVSYPDNMVPLSYKRDPTRSGPVGRARLIRALVAALALTTLSARACLAQDIAAIPRTDPNSQAAHLQLLQKAKTGRIDIYFLGDSITRRWGTADEQYRDLHANWSGNFHGWNAADFGWGGDTTRNILWRIQNGELDGVNPQIIVLLAGTNDLTSFAPGLSENEKVASVTRGVSAILTVCRSKAPHATLILMGITPRNDFMELLPLIRRIDARLAALADGKTIRYLNINERLADPSGRLHSGMTYADGLHLADKGYQVWADALKPVFTQLLGPPAPTDTAPPPSRDPGLSTTPGG
jgi:lysophospholipase L1-like esterase